MHPCIYKAVNRSLICKRLIAYKNIDIVTLIAFKLLIGAAHLRVKFEQGVCFVILRTVFMCLNCLTCNVVSGQPNVLENVRFFFFFPLVFELNEGQKGVFILYLY